MPTTPFCRIRLDGYFHLETFEDQLFNTPGVTGNGVVTSTAFTGSIIDSVFADGPCPDPTAPNPCDSYFSGAGTLTFTFDELVLGALPTHVGLVWTDGGGATFTAVAADGGVIGPVAGIPDGDFLGGTAEDRFFGWISGTGISSITIANPSGIEIDHLQYGGISEVATPVPEPASLLLVGMGGVGLVAKVRRRRKAVRV